MLSKRGLAKKVAKNAIRGVIKELPHGGALVDQLIYGVLDELAAESRDEHLKKALEKIRQEHADQEGDLARLIVGVEASYDLNQEIKSELSTLCDFLQNPQTAEVPDKLVAAFETMLGTKTDKLSSEHADLRRLLEQLVADSRRTVAQESPQPSGSPEQAVGCFHVPTLPQHFFPRHEYIEGIKSSLLHGDRQRLGITGQRIGLHGMGGIGKTVLAAWIARDANIQKAFYNGVVWLTIGQNPNPMARIADVFRALVGSAPAFDDLQDACNQLRTLLTQSSCLLILDDVWQKDHAEVFADCLGPDCRMLLTTRDASILTALEAAEHNLLVLPPAAALEFLANWADRKPKSLPSTAHDVAEHCNGLPLALALCGANVRDGVSWEDLLEALKRADLEFLDHPQGSIVASIKVSVDSLPTQDAQRYIDLAVFGEDIPIPEQAIVTLWCRDDAISPPRARKLLAVLQRKALIKLTGKEKIRRFTLHDLQYDFVRSKVFDVAGLHNLLLDAYSSACRDGWATGPNDGYFFQNLISHLLRVGRTRDAETLLLDFAWLRARLGATDVNGLLLDSDTASTSLAPAHKTVRDALRLSAHVLAEDKSQLAAQLLGRLLNDRDSQVRTLLRQAKPDRGLWLRPTTQCLTPPGGPLLRTLKGHTSGVNSVALTSDGARAISASEDNTLKLWDSATGKCMDTFEGHSFGVNSVALTGDGARAVSAFDDNTLKLWDLATGKCLRTFEGHSYMVNSVALTPDGARAISGSNDDTLRLWDLTTGECIRSFEGHSDRVNSVALTADGARAISASSDGTLKLWDLDTGKCLRSFKGHTWHVSSVALTGDGARAISASSDKRLKLWDAATGKCLRTFEGHTGWVRSVALAGDGARAISGSDDNTVKLWDLATGKCLCSFTADAPIESCAVTPDGQTIVAGDSTGRVLFLTLQHTKIVVH